MDFLSFVFCQTWYIFLRANQEILHKAVIVPEFQSLYPALVFQFYSYFHPSFPMKAIFHLQNLNYYSFNDFTIIFTFCASPLCAFRWCVVSLIYTVFPDLYVRMCPRVFQAST